METIKFELNNDSDFLTVYDRHPHISEKISFVWGYDVFYIYLKNLLSDTRNGKRQGFSPDILFALLSLSSKHDVEYPELVLKPKDFWET